MPNRLEHETSPYLLQHRNNPVDWHPWGQEAFLKAVEEDKPIFLSVGYSSCHWCHVMEHESFEDSEVAAFLNEHFVSVKVDREERPDVDQAYMTAVQLSSGRGGWPMSVFLTPEKNPFFAGTYFPKQDRGEYPGFLSICQQIAEAWNERREEIQDAAARFAEALSQSLVAPGPDYTGALDALILDAAVQDLAHDFDNVHGGFGHAPKFPPHSAIEFLLLYAEGPEGPKELRETARHMALFTLEKMVLGGIHDHVGGGFHRYSTDEHWLLPHFEKMLYDNALMLSNLAHSEEFAPARLGIIQWLRRDMTAPQGYFYSALDADSEGEEGKYYVWTEEEVASVLGARAPAFMAAYGFERDGNFREEATGHRTGANIPHLKEPSSFEPELSLLLEARKKRVRPELDDKAIVAWNGLMIAALVKAGEAGLASQAVDALLACERESGRLPHHIAKGRPSGDAFLEDYAYFIWGLIALGRTDEARRLCKEMVAKFYDENRGGFYSTSIEHERLFGRTKPVFDQPLPSGNAVALRCLLALGDFDRAGRSLQSLLGWMHRAPQATEALHTAALQFLRAQIAPASHEVHVSLSEWRINGDWAEATVKIEIPSGMYINSDSPPEKWLAPTLILGAPITPQVSYPAGERYQGTVDIPVRVSLAEGEQPDSELRVSYQACTESECLLPQEVVIPVTIRRS